MIYAHMTSMERPARSFNVQDLVWAHGMVTTGSLDIPWEDLVHIGLLLGRQWSRALFVTVAAAGPLNPAPSISPTH